MYGKYSLHYFTTKNWGYYTHVQTVCTRPLLEWGGPVNEATSLLVPKVSHLFNPLYPNDDYSPHESTCRYINY